MTSAPEPADPRPRLLDSSVVGSYCATCEHRSARASSWCERCLAEADERRYGPEGTVWSATTMHFDVGGRRAPFVLAYVDLDDGPRVLARIASGVEPPSGTAVRLVGDDDGDLLVEPVGATEMAS